MAKKNSHFKEITLKDVKKNPIVNSYLHKAEDIMNAMGYTEHGTRHASLTANIAKNILEYWSCKSRESELASIAGYLHDIGNAIARNNHSQSGALLSYDILKDMNMKPEEIATVIGAIGNHEEEAGGVPISMVSAALILADKTDVHRSRVSNPDTDKKTFDIHDRINYYAVSSFLRVDKCEKTITLELTIDTKFAPVMEYFEIFLQRMLMCRKAASFMGANFKLEINKVKLL